MHCQIFQTSCNSICISFLIIRCSKNLKGKKKTFLKFLFFTLLTKCAEKRIDGKNGKFLKMYSIFFRTQISQAVKPSYLHHLIIRWNVNGFLEWPGKSTKHGLILMSLKFIRNPISNGWLVATEHIVIWVGVASICLMI